MVTTTGRRGEVLFCRWCMDDHFNIASYLPEYTHLWLWCSHGQLRNKRWYSITSLRLPLVASNIIALYNVDISQASWGLINRTSGLWDLQRPPVATPNPFRSYQLEDMIALQWLQESVGFLFPSSWRPTNREMIGAEDETLTYPQRNLISGVCKTSLTTDFHNRLYIPFAGS
jgi:hypothetical protein